MGLDDRADRRSDEDETDQFTRVLGQALRAQHVGVQDGAVAEPFPADPLAKTICTLRYSGRPNTNLSRLRF